MKLIIVTLLSDVGLVNARIANISNKTMESTMLTLVNENDNEADEKLGLDLIWVCLPAGVGDGLLLLMIVKPSFYVSGDYDKNKARSKLTDWIIILCLVLIVYEIGWGFGPRFLYWRRKRL